MTVEGRESLPIVNMPTDAPRKAVPSMHSRRVAREFPEGLAIGLSQLSKQFGSTMEDVVLAAIHALLYRYTGQDDLVIGVQSATGSVHPSRVHVAPDQPFSTLVQSVRCGPAIETDVSVFQVGYAWGSVASADPGQSPYELSLIISDKVLAADYRVELLEHETVEKLLESLETMLVGIVEQPDSDLLGLPVLSALERQRVLHGLNDTSVDYGPEECIHTMFERQVAKTPDAVALVFEGQVLTYRQLNERANQVAHYLVRSGVGPDVRVGVCMDRSLEMLIAIYGVLKTGGVYVPVDPYHPAERMAFTMEDSQVPLMLTQKRWLEQLPNAGFELICLDTEWTKFAEESTENPGGTFSPDNMISILYTSGSTGKPKGVMSTHRGICNLLRWMQGVFGLTPDDRHVLKTPYSFDVSAWELFWPLVYGARLVIARPEGHKDSAYLVKLVKEQGITTIVFAPSMMQLFLEEHGVEDCTTIKRALCAGEALPFELQERYFAKLDAELHNLYGPTEASVIVLHWQCERESAKRVVPIGYPIANTQIYLLDDRMQPVPRGVAGELFIGGTAVARGYLNRPELNEEKFVVDPFTTKPGARLYRTGDLARHLPDGTIDYIGRIDHQVKLRGLRIELGEIEAVLQTHEAVREVVVVAQEDRHGGKFLAAFLTAVEGADLDQTVLRHYVKSKLPDYMVPNVFVVLEQMPLSPNGKIDRKALPQVSFSDNAREEHIAPRTPLEQTIAQIWQDVLQVPDVGVTDHFFYLGGHSLFANQVVARLRETLGAHLSVGELFDCPTVEELAVLLEGRSTERSESVAWETSERPEQLPLSHAQEAMWFVEQLNPDTTQFNVPFGLRLEGNLDVDALRGSLSEVVRRHEALRTVFTVVDEKPMQRIVEPSTWDVPLVDLSEETESERQSAFERLLANDAQQPFDLQNGPLYRGCLVRMRSEDYLLLLNIHHIVFDARSLDVFKRELLALYEGSVLAEVAMQYPDHAYRERNRLEEGQLRGLEYWTRQLAGSLPQIDLPMDRPLTADVSTRGRMQRSPLPVEVTAAVKSLCREERVTPFMVFLAVYNLLLHRLSGLDDLIVGTPVANRDRLETEEMIGLLLNTLPLRCDLSGNPSFRDLLRRVRSVTLQGYEHAAVPFEKVVEAVQPERSLLRNPIFDVMINYLDSPETTVQAAGIRATTTYDFQLVSKHLMTLFVQEVEQVMVLELVCRAELFSEVRGAMLLEQLQGLLQQTLAEPDRPIGTFTLLTETAQAILPEVAMPLDEPQYPSVLTEFRARAMELPTKSAVVQAGRAVSYGDLLARVDRLAHALRAQGLQKGDVTAVISRRRIGFVVSALAVLQSGGVLLPVDADLPPLRQRMMLEQAVPKRLLLCTEQELADEVRDLAEGLPLLRVSEETGDVGTNSVLAGEESAVWEELEPDAPAYLFFTSGTTNLPKGVLGTHKGLNHFLAWQREEFHVGSEDRVAQMIHLSFDAILRDIFLPLTAGATLHLLDEPEDLSPDVVFPWLERERITILHSVPSLAQSWLQGAPEGVTLPSLRWLFLSGEPLTDGFVTRWHARFTEGELVNFYGPTETTMIKTSYHVRRGEVMPGLQPAGWPQPNTQVWVVNASGQLCGIGEAGEIVLRTPFGTLGYLNAPEEQALRFRPNPFGEAVQDRVYYTGDRGRYRPDGALEVLGRLDDQIKVRGVRVQLGEVSAVLMRHPAVAACTVLDLQDAQGQTQLAAYVVPTHTESISVEELRLHLERRLPSAFVPAYYLLLDALPLMVNGKVDRRALPRPEVAAGIDPDVRVAQTGIEATVSKIWSEVLGLERIGVNQNFFALGGHSLLSTQVMSRVRRQFGVDLPLRHLFEGPTIEQLAIAVETALREQPVEQLGELTAISREGALPLSDMQKQLWFFEQLESQSALYHVPFALRFEGDLNKGHLQAALQEIICRHESLRTAFRAQEDEAVAIVLPPEAVNLPMTDLQGHAYDDREQVLERMILEDSARPFDMHAGSLYQFHLYRLAPSEHVLLATLHHIISDGWSAGVFTREVAALYTAFAQGKPSPLIQPAWQYVDYAAWQQRFVQSEAYERQVAYWKRQLGGQLPILELPTDRPHPSKPSYAGAVIRTSLPSALVQQVEAFALEQEVTVQMVMLTAFQAMLYARTRQEDLLIGVPVANRLLEETEGLIGYFVNTLVLRTSLAGNPSIGEWLHRVRLTSLEAYAHQSVPFEKLVAELQPERNLSRSPLFQVMFNYQLVAQNHYQLPDLQMSTISVGRETAKFDLNVHVHQYANGIDVLFEYRTDLFESVTMQGMAEQFQELLHRLTEDPEIRLREIVQSPLGDLEDELFG
ncbi:non-ribosomal peptide synthetase [Tumebacillus permanentifrigoris]|nr:non-ribosomal peptide synthetase [Tumebacillus permanentifrigoris]